MTPRTAKILTVVGATIFLTMSPLLIVVYRIVTGVWPL